MRITFFIAAAALALASCGTAAGTSDEASSLYLSEADINILIDTAPEAQQRFIEDGLVTDAEREAAYLEFIGCMEDQGIATLNYELGSNGGDTFEQDSGSIDPEQVNSITTSCRSAHYVEVGAVYEFNNRLSEEDQQRILDDTAACMRDKGFDVVEGATLDQMNEIERTETATCWAAASSQ